MRNRTPHFIRGTYSKSPNLKQNASPPTASTNVLPSSSGFSQPQAATTAVSSSSLASPPQRRSLTSPPQPVGTPAPPSSDSFPPPRTPFVSPRQLVSTAAPPSSVPSQPRTSSASSPRPHEGSDRRTPIQALAHSPEVEHARTLAPVHASPPPPVQAQPIDSQPKTLPYSKEKNWFQNHVWDYDIK